MLALVLLPGIRRWFRRRAERVIHELDQRLRRRLQRFDMTRIGEAIPALCVPLLAKVFLAAQEPLTALKLEAGVQERMQAADARVRLHRALRLSP